MMLPGSEESGYVGVRTYPDTSTPGIVTPLKRLTNATVPNITEPTCAPTASTPLCLSIAWWKFPIPSITTFFAKTCGIRFRLRFNTTISSHNFSL